MPDCKHEQLKADSFIDNAGKPAQKVFTFLRCKTCGAVFPIKPDRNRIDNTASLRDIEQALRYINQNLSEIKNKIKY